METITEAKSFRYTITLYENEIHIQENASFGENISNVFKKIHIMKKDKHLLINSSYKLQEISEARFVDVLKDTSQLVLELKNGDTKTFDMTTTDKNNPTVLKTKIKLIVEHIQSRK